MEDHDQEDAFVENLRKRFANHAIYVRTQCAAAPACVQRISVA